MTKSTTRNEARYGEFLAAMTDLVLVFDTDGHCTDAWLDGVPDSVGLPDSPAGMTADEIFDGKASTAITSAVRLTIDTGAPMSFEFELPDRSSDGEARTNGGSTSLRVYHATASPVPAGDETGGTGAAIVVARDLTERRLIEDQLLQSQKLESVGTLVGGIAHDFNNLLMAILGYSEMLLMNLPTEDPKTRYAQRINTAGERARGLVQQMLLYSRREAPRMEPLDANASVNSAIELLSRSLDKKIQLRTELEWQLPLVMADRVQIDQALMNICVNGAMALKARKEPDKPGTLQVSTSRIDFEEGDPWPYQPAQPGSYVSISVEDNGIGMSEEIQSRIFEPFFTTREPGEGTGLGLSVAFSIIRKHKGYLLVSSTPDVGTTFQILLPVRSGMTVPGREAVAESAATPTASNVTGESAGGQSQLFQTVLVADDEDGARGVIGEYLREMGYRVLEAVDGVDAVKLYKKRGSEVDLVLMDVVMPRMNGVEASRKILNIDPQARILYITGHARGYAQSGNVDDEGVLGVIHKPFSLREIDRKVKRVLAT